LNLTGSGYATVERTHLDEAEANVVLADVLVLQAEEGGGGNALQPPVLGQPLHKPAQQNSLMPSADTGKYDRAEITFFYKSDLILY